MKKKPELTYSKDTDSGIIWLFVDGETVSEWMTEGDESSEIAGFDEFKKIFSLGFDYRNNEIVELKEILEKSRLELESWNLQSGDEETNNLIVEISAVLSGE